MIAPLFSLRNEAEYDAAVERLNALLDVVGTIEEHPLYSLLDTLGTLIHSYEAEHHAIPAATGPEVLEFCSRSEPALAICVRSLTGDIDGAT